MSPVLRRLLNHLPIPHRSRGAQYLKPTWHKPTQFDQWRSQAPFLARPALRSDHFGRSLRRRRVLSGLLRCGLIAAAVWLIIESARAFAL